MAKKGQPVQLQAEINNDDEWEKLLQRDGLIGENFALVIFCYNLGFYSDK